MSGPPPVLRIGIEQVKPMHEAVHERSEYQWMRAFARAKVPMMVIGTEAVSGSSDAWFISGFPSFDAVEKNQAAMTGNAALQADVERIGMADADHLTGGRVVLAAYRPTLSIPGEVQLPKQRYFRVTIYRLRPGHVPDFEQHRRMMIDAERRANNPVAFAAYQVVSGMQGPAFLVFQPMRSMSELDFDSAATKRYDDALGDSARKTMARLASDAFISVENEVLAFSPRMSYVTAEFAAGDPDFWAPKPKVAAKPTATRPVADRPRR